MRHLACFEDGAGNFPKAYYNQCHRLEFEPELAMQNRYVIAILADIHGTLPPLEAVLAELCANPPDEIVVAGDFLSGPQPREVFFRKRL